MSIPTPPILTEGPAQAQTDPASSQELYIVLEHSQPQLQTGDQDQEASSGRAGLNIKIGTCEHCVVHEAGRPARAWDANGDRELDFNRDALIAGLTALGVAVEIEEQFVCP